MRRTRFILWTTMAVFLLSVRGTGATQAPSIPEHIGVVQFANLDSVLFNPASRFKHVVVIIQENRSFDNLFNGFPGANTVRYGKTHTGKSVALKPTPFEGPYDPDHEHSAWVADYNHGRMNGFDLPPTTPAGPPDFNYGYVPQAETVPYFEMGKEFAIADRNFAAETGPSYPGHQYLVAGQSDYAIGNPNDPLFRWGCDALPGTTTPILEANGTVNPNGPFPCFNYGTLADLLDAKRVSWKYYTDSFEKFAGAGVQPYAAIRHIRYGPDWNKVVTPQTQILNDVATGSLPSMSWVNPPLVASDHAQQTTNLGPYWVANIVNTIGQSKYWKDTAIFVTWDDWGGWYDHVRPPQLDRMGLSFRVPLLAIAPYAKHGYVSHVQHEPGSILKFAELTFHLSSLGTTDVRADNLADMFDCSQLPPPFVRIHTKVAANYFKALPPDTKAIDY